MLDANIPGPLIISEPMLDNCIVAIGVIAQAVPVTTKNGCSAPIKKGINQLAFPLIISAPAATKSFK